MRTRNITQSLGVLSRTFHFFSSFFSHCLIPSLFFLIDEPSVNTIVPIVCPDLLCLIIRFLYAVPQRCMFASFYTHLHSAKQTFLLLPASVIPSTFRFPYIIPPLPPVPLVEIVVDVSIFIFISSPNRHPWQSLCCIHCNLCFCPCRYY